MAASKSALKKYSTIQAFYVVNTLLIQEMKAVEGQDTFEVLLSPLRKIKKAGGSPLVAL